jgi:hypothetical protein
MTLLGLDINSTRIRAVQGNASEFPLPLALDPPAADLPLILSLENGSPEVGLAGLRLCRRQPYLACQGFLPHLADVNETHRRFWSGGRHRFDAVQAMGVVWKRLEPVCRKSAGVVLGLPGYLSHAQATLIHSLGAARRISIAGSLPSQLAAALAGYADQAWSDEVLVIDIDDHALSLVLVRAVDGQAHVLDAKYLPQLGMRAWREKVINALADLCVLQSRRDPRGSPQADQGLFDQLDGLFDSCQKGRMIQLGVQATTWYQNLVLQPEQAVNFCAGLMRQAVHEIEGMWGRMRRSDRSFPTTTQFGTAPEPGRAIFLATHAVGRLPGFVTALRKFVETRNDSLKPQLAEGEDFGENLMGGMPADTASVAVLGPDAPARAIHGLGTFFQQNGNAAAGHLELVAPLPKPATVEAGPPRLHFQGQDYLLGEHSFFLGCHDTCHLVVDDPRHAAVDAGQCEIVFDHRAYILFNRSRDATLVNDFPVNGSVVLHPGDWIRLGFEGPLVRFLGQANNSRTPLTA